MIPLSLSYRAPLRHSFRTAVCRSQSDIRRQALSPPFAEGYHIYTCPSSSTTTTARTTTTTTTSRSLILHHHHSPFSTKPTISSSSSSSSTITTTMTSSSEKTANWEAKIQRNPHPDFKKVEASRPPFDSSSFPSFRYTQSPCPSWTFGSGSSSGSGAPSSTSGEQQQQKQQQEQSEPAAAKEPEPQNDNQKNNHRIIDPHSPARPSHLNYKLLISAIVPRPIAFLSTRSADGSISNLAPFSYFQTIGHDPPLFVVGFASSLASPKDSLRLLAETKECTINLISEDFIEAANSTSINAPLGVSEWDVSGLTPLRDCETVKAARVGEAVFAIEGKLESLREFESRSTPGKVSTTMAVIEGTRFWVKEDAVNDEGSLIDAGKLRAVSRLGGITYGVVREGFELPRPDFEKDLGGREGYKKLVKGKQEREGEGEEKEVVLN